MVLYRIDGWRRRGCEWPAKRFSWFSFLLCWWLDTNEVTIIILHFLQWIQFNLESIRYVWLNEEGSGITGRPQITNVKRRSSDLQEKYHSQLIQFPRHSVVGQGANSSNVRAGRVKALWSDGGRIILSTYVLLAWKIDIYLFWQQARLQMENHLKLLPLLHLLIVISQFGLKKRDAGRLSGILSIACICRSVLNRFALINLLEEWNCQDRMSLIKWSSIRV